MPTTRDLLADATEALARAGVPSPRVDAELLLAHVTGRRRGQLTLGADPTAEQAGEFGDLVSRRTSREPLQHITGTAPFRYLELAVGPGVFVPRPETEPLVDVAAAHARALHRRAVIVDLCTGSGALALALATELPGCDVTAVERSPAALAWAQRNIEAHLDLVRGSGSGLALVAADATVVTEPGGPLAHLLGQVDVVVTNPPYVPDGAVPREPEVRDHDPAEALYGGPDGLDVVRALIVQSARLLRPGGLLLVEHADVQGERAGALGVPGLLRRAGGPAPLWREVLDHLDLAGLPRFTSALRTESSLASPS